MLVFLFLLAAPALGDWTPPTPKTNFFTQVLDHFNAETSPASFAQKYFTYDGYYDGKGPIFFYCGNEGPIEEFYHASGFVFTAAQQNNALVVFAEHRYYGETMPFGKDSFDFDKVGYLTVEQALADYAELLTELLGTAVPSDTKIIAFGGSYGGMLSAWFRRIYPTVITGAISSSAPIRMSAQTVNHFHFWQIVTEDVEMANAACPPLFRRAFAEVIELGKSSTGRQQLSEQFNLCQPLTSEEEVEHLVLWAQNALGYLAMMDYPCPTDFLAPMPAYPIKEACRRMMNGSSLLSGLAAAAGLWYSGSNSTLKCYDIWTEFIECADQSGCGGVVSAWDYQACFEVVYFPSTNNVTDMFPPRIWDLGERAPAEALTVVAEKHTAYCKKKWGIIPRHKWAALHLGGDSPSWSLVTNIFFTNGQLDPWRAGGFVEAPSAGTESFVIEGGAHHLDLRAPDETDPASVQMARKRALELIAEWLR